MQDDTMQEISTCLDDMIAGSKGEDQAWYRRVAAAIGNHRNTPENEKAVKLYGPATEEDINATKSEYSKAVLDTLEQQKEKDQGVKI